MNSTKPLNAIKKHKNRSKLSNAWNNKGCSLNVFRNYIIEKKYKDAIQCYQKAIQIEPNYLNAWNKFGNALDDLQNYEEAINCYEQMISFERNSFNTCNNKGFIYFRSLGKVVFNLKQYDEAFECYEQAKKLEQINSKSFYEKSSINFLEFQGKYQMNKHYKQTQIVLMLGIVREMRQITQTDIKKLSSVINNQFIQTQNNLKLGQIKEMYYLTQQIMRKLQNAMNKQQIQNQKDIKAWNKRGTFENNFLAKVLYIQRKYEKALQTYEQSLKIVINNSNGWSGKGDNFNNQQFIGNVLIE